MGQKCSCLFNKEEHDTYIFKNKESDSTNVVTNIQYSKYTNTKKTTSDISVLKVKEEDNIEKEIVLRNLIKLQSLIRSKLAIKKFNENKSIFKNETNSLLNDLLSKYQTEIISKVEEIHPFNKKASQELYNNEYKEILNTVNNSKLKADILFLKDGSFYSGEVNEENKPNGFGFCFKADGKKLIGNWINGLFTGYGRIIDSKGSLKEGKYLNSSLEGKGIEIKLDGTEYKGDFKNNLKEGRGCEESNEAKYVGLFSKDIKYGYGKLTFKLNNDVYEGMFENNAINGTGTYTWANQNVYKGTFKDGKMHGSGHYTWPDGGEYKGEYIENIKEGYGWFKWANGRIYEGPFKDGKPHGIGNLTIKDKTIEVEFIQGKINKNFKK
jgi:hypothetical protein